MLKIVIDYQCIISCCPVNPPGEPVWNRQWQAPGNDQEQPTSYSVMVERGMTCLYLRRIHGPVR
jgi:hypothetical protein